MRNSLPIGLLASAATIAIASGQQPSVYIDVQSNAVSPYGLPQASFAAAAPAPGVWTVLDTDALASTPATSPPLDDASGTATGITITVDSPTMSLLGFDEDSVQTMGDDEALLDDCGFFAGPGTFTFNAVPAGTYDLYTYALAPDVGTYPAPPTTTVDVAGSTGVQTISGEFIGGYVVGATHSLHTVTVGPDGTIVVQTDVPAFASGEFDTINGFQLVPSGGLSLIGSAFCAANPNSTGVRGRCTAVGSTLVANNDVTLGVFQVPPGQFGLFMVAATRGAVQPVNQGVLCLSGTIGRFSMPGQIWQASAGGQATLSIDLTAIPTPLFLVATSPGDTWSFQAWHRDASPAPGQPGSNFTTGIEIQFD